MIGRIGEVIITEFVPCAHTEAASRARARGRAIS